MAFQNVCEQKPPATSFEIVFLACCIWSVSLFIDVGSKYNLHRQSELNKVANTKEEKSNRCREIGRPNLVATFSNASRINVKLVSLPHNICYVDGNSFECFGSLLYLEISWLV